MIHNLRKSELHFILFKNNNIRDGWFVTWVPLKENVGRGYRDVKKRVGEGEGGGGWVQKLSLTVSGV